MALGIAAWLTAGRLRARRRLEMDYPRRRHELAARLATGASFIDVGGMWNAHGEIAFAAEDAGAERVVLFDAMEPTDEFLAEHARRGPRSSSSAATSTTATRSPPSAASARSGVPASSTTRLTPTSRSSTCARSARAGC